MMQESTEQWSAQERAATRFDYEALNQETRAFVLQKTAETHGYLQRTAEDIVQIGQNLAAVKHRLGHGHFMAWVQAEFGMTYRTALNCIRVADRFSEKVKSVSTLPSAVLYMLAQPSTSETLIHQVMSGQVPPTLEAIRAARAAEQQARQAKEQAELERDALQRQLLEERSHAQAAHADLAHQLEQAQRPVQEQRREGEKPVLPPEVSTQLERLRDKVTTLTKQRDALSREVTALGEQARLAAFSGGEEEAHAKHLRTSWHLYTEAALQAIANLLVHWPGPVEGYQFEQEEWSKLAQLQEHIEHLQAACRHLRETVERTVSVES